MSLAQEANRYLDDKSPWKVIKQDRPAAAASLYTAIGVISELKTMLYPSCPSARRNCTSIWGSTAR